MTEPNPDREIEPEYPASIVTEPFAVDGLTFAPIGPHGTMEQATRAGGELVGDVLLDASGWFARKKDSDGLMSDWRPMRCAAEARAFLVSKKPI